MVADPSGHQWGIEIDAPGSLDGQPGGTAVVFGLRIIRALKGGWRVSVYEVRSPGDWRGPVCHREVTDEAAAIVEAASLTQAIIDGSWRQGA